jgi:hypothetical protein
MNKLETILEYIEEGKNKEKAEKLLRDNRWRMEKEKLEKLLKLLRLVLSRSSERSEEASEGKNRSHEEKCPDFDEVARFYYGELPSDRRGAFIGHLARCRGFCIDALLSLRESERRAGGSGEKAENLLEKLRDEGLISEGLLAYINPGSGVSQPIPDPQTESARAEQLRAYEFLRRYGAAVVALTVARAIRGSVLRAGGESLQSAVKESNGFRVEVYPSPEAPGRLEVEVSLKPDVEKAKYEGAEVLVFVQAGEAKLSGIGVMRDGLVSGLALGGGKVDSRVFDDPERMKIELYIGERK